MTHLGAHCKLTKCTEEEANKLVDGSSVNLTIATTFGQLAVSAQVTHHFQTTTSDIMKDPVANIIQKSILRCLTISTVSAEEGEKDDSLQSTISSLMSCLH